MNALNIIGAIVTAAIVAGVVFCLFATGVQKLQDVYRNSLYHSLDRELRRHGVSMQGQVHWFTPTNVDQAAVWAAFADSLAGGHWPDVTTMRDQTIPAARRRIAREWGAPDA